MIRCRPWPAMVGLLLSLSTAGALAGPQPLTDFDQLLSTLREGAAVRVVVEYGRCELIADNEPVEAPEAIGGMVVDTWEYFAAGSIRNDEAFLVFSHASLIEHPRRGMTTNHVKFKVFAGGEVVVSARYLDPQTGEETMFEKFFTRIAKGDQGAAAFYRLD
jgi:hypothetical protein